MHALRAIPKTLPPKPRLLLFHLTAAMIACSSCREWFHGRCVGLNQSQMRSQRQYTCPVCTAVKGSEEQLDRLVEKLQRTRRPQRSELAALLPDLEVSRCRCCACPLLRWRASAPLGSLQPCCLRSSHLPPVLTTAAGAARGARGGGAAGPHPQEV